MATTTDPTTAPPARRHGARAALYGALAGTFVYPEESTLGEVTPPDVLAALEAAGDPLGLEPEAVAFAEALSRASLPAVQGAHERLFGVPGEEGSYPVVPYEAHYTVRDDVGQRQRRIATVSGLLEALGLQRSDDFHERRDHLAVELETMQVLAARRATTIERGFDDETERVRRAEATLVDRHLSEFVPPVAHRIREAVESGTAERAGEGGSDAGAGDGETVYVAAADLAEALVTDDAARLADVAVEGGDSR